MIVLLATGLVRIMVQSATKKQLIREMQVSVAAKHGAISSAIQAYVMHSPTALANTNPLDTATPIARKI